MTETGETDRARGPGGAAHVSGGGPLWWPRRRSAALDIALAVVSAAECVAEGVEFAKDTGVPVVLAVAMGLIVGSMMVLRLRWPVAVVLVSIAVMPAEMGYLLGIVGLYTLAASEVPRRIIGLLAGMQLVGSLTIGWVRLQQRIGQEPKFDPAEWFVPVMSVLVAVGLTAPPLLLGMYAGARRRLVESLRERADGLERELSLLADRAEERAVWARREERTRIAREMHDVVAHRVSLMVVHAAALQAVALKDPEKASKNAALVGDMGRQALTELRTMLGVLRTADAESAVAAVTGGSGGSGASGSAGAGTGAGSGAGSGADSTGSGREATAPSRLAAFAAAASGAGPGAETRVGAGPGAESAGEARDRADGSGPTLGELDVLVGQSRAAGMVVELEVAGEPRAYSSRVERTAYRVVQEALTNVHKHAAGAVTRVRLAHRPGEVALQVENEPPAEGVTDAGLPSGGNGLVGMKERVAALGGVFVSGQTEAGGFRVSAVIPQDDVS